LGRVIKDEGFLLFPTLTSGASTTTSRPAGQTKCEKWFKDNGLIPNGSQLGTQAIALTMGFPSNWFKSLSEQYLNKATIPSQVKHQEELEPDILQDEQLPQDKQPLPSPESSISIPCLVKQPKQPEVKGIISQDEGDRFLVEVDGEKISISKLFVYPDFSKTPKGYRSAYVGQIEKNPSKNLSPSKKRRRKGEGNGSIYWRTITKNGKDYPQAYYHWKENGRKRSKYIPKHLFVTIQSAENQKRSVVEILSLLGEKNISPSKNESPSKSQRRRGEGSGSIHCKPIKRGNKTYPQYWYHYEFWQEGDRLTKKSRYIPKRLLARVEKLEAEKAPVREILLVLGKR
jgi:hypothetical protein